MSGVNRVMGMPFLKSRRGPPSSIHQRALRTAAGLRLQRIGVHRNRADPSAWAKRWDERGFCSCRAVVGGAPGVAPGRATKRVFFGAQLAA